MLSYDVTINFSNNKILNKLIIYGKFAMVKLFHRIVWAQYTSSWQLLKLGAVWCYPLASKDG